MVTVIVMGQKYWNAEREKWVRDWCLATRFLPGNLKHAESVARFVGGRVCFS